MTLLIQDSEEAEAVQLELKAHSLRLFCQLLPVFLDPLQCWLQIVCMNLHD